MNTIKFDPRRPVVRRNFLEDFLNNPMGNVVGTDYVKNAPAVNVTESANGFSIDLAAPGLEKEDFKIAIEKERLVITAEQEKSEETKEDKYTRREFNYSNFKRAFHLPKIVDRDKIEASYKSGVLIVSLPKKAEVLRDEQMRTIEIK